jgi:hypothetical protein
MRISQFARKQRATIISGIAAFQMIIVLLQLWLFTTTMETFLAGHQETALPAALASLLCFATENSTRVIAGSVEPEFFPIEVEIDQGCEH